MVKITNRTKSPFDLQGLNGPIRIPAEGTIEAEFDPDYLEILAAGGNVIIEDSAPKPKRGRPRKETGSGN